jgi:hypothetical protein
MAKSKGRSECSEMEWFLRHTLGRGANGSRLGMLSPKEEELGHLNQSHVTIQVISIFRLASMITSSMLMMTQEYPRSYLSTMEVTLWMRQKDTVVDRT